MPAEKRPVKIIRIFSRLCVGGPSIHVINLNHLMDKDKYESILVTGVTEPEEGDMRYLAEGKGLDIRTIPEMGVKINVRKDLIATWKLWKIIRREKPDIVHSHTAKAGFQGRILGKLAGVPIRVHTMHGHSFRGYRTFYGSAMYRRIERMLTRLCDTVVTVSEDVKQGIVENRVAPPEKIRVVALGFDFSFLDDLEAERGRLKKELGLPEGTVTAGVVSRIVPIKNLAMFIRAGKMLLERGKKIKLIVVGDGESRQDLEETVRQEDMAPHVRFLGFRKDLSRIYAGLDLLINCSHNEGTAVSLIEAMAAGVPVAATKVGGTGDLLGYGEYGLLVEPENTADLADKMARLIDEPGLAESLRSKARDRIRARYALPRLIGDMDRLYSELLEKKRIGAP
jgi:glycosyltransferase involved in cell wall biosynthesis